MTERTSMGMACRWALILAAALCAFVVMTALLRWLAPPGQPVSWMHAPSVYSWVAAPADDEPVAPAAQAVNPARQANKPQ